MEKEYLSPSYALNYDPLTEQYVVTEKLKTLRNPEIEIQCKMPVRPHYPNINTVLVQSEDAEFSQEEIENEHGEQSLENRLLDQPLKSNITQPSFPQPPRPPRPPEVSESVALSRELYNRFRILSNLYEELSSENLDFDDMNSEMKILTVTMLNIYQNLSGTNNIPYQNLVMPTYNGYCQGVTVTRNYLRETMSKVRRLQRLVNIQNINRQLTIVYLTLQSQESQLLTMEQNCNKGQNCNKELNDGKISSNS